MIKFSPPEQFSNGNWYQKVILFLSFGFGSGFLRPASGTWGTLPGVLLGYLLLSYSAHAVGFVLLGIVIVGGTLLCQLASNILGVHDHSGIVIDEIAGILLTYFLCSYYLGMTMWLFFWGFVLFRFFDIVKPQPIGWVDKKVHGGLGIMLDDLLAGIMAFLVIAAYYVLLALAKLVG